MKDMNKPQQTTNSPKEPDVPEALLQMADVAQRCGVGIDQVRTWIKTGQLRRVGIGRRVYITEEALTQFLNGEQNQ